MGDVRSRPLPSGADTGGTSVRRLSAGTLHAARAANFLDRPVAVFDRMTPAPCSMAVQALTGDFS